MESKVVTSIDDIYPLKAAWQNLHSRCSPENPFSSFEWQSAWWETFATTQPLQLITVFEDEQLVGLMALMQKKIARTVNVWQFNDKYSDFPVALVEPNRPDIWQEVAFVLRRLLGWQGLLCWRHADAESTAIPQLLSAAHQSRLRSFEYPGPPVAYIPTSGTYDDYKHNIHRLKSIERYNRKLHKKGAVVVEVLEHPDQVERGFEELLNISRQTWKAKAGTAIAVFADLELFLRKISNSFSRRNWWRLYLLRHENKPIAFTLCFQLKDVLYFYKPGFVNSYKKYSPGNILQLHIVKQCFSDPAINEYNLLGLYRYGKEDWTRFLRQRRNIIIRPAYSPLAAGIEYLFRAKRLIRNIQSR
jgi:CelD/BcsL family acetyltransferase involved in cellulose biosynthesis